MTTIYFTLICIILQIVQIKRLQLDSDGKREKPESSLTHSSMANREEEWLVVANGCKDLLFHRQNSALSPAI